MENRERVSKALDQGHDDVALHRDTTPADANPLVPWLEANSPETILSIGYIRHATQGAIETGPFIPKMDSI